jgi:hypothetical protein
MLRVAQRLAQQSGNPKALNVAMTKMLGVEEFCTQEPYFEGEEVFGSQKRKADIPLGSEYKSHKPDRMNFSRPRIRIRSTRTRSASCNLNDILEELSPNLQDNNRTIHITAIKETTYKETKWYIVKLLKTSAKAYFAHQAITKKKCEAKIVQGNRAMATPTYTGIMVHYKKKKNEVMQFFYNDDIKRFVKGIRWRWIKSRPEVPNVWLVKIGTNLLKEI